nr:reverse transcriptase domain-containing protein [Tanacetum cinerariifolium]
MRYSLTYDDTSVNRFDVIDVTCEEFVQDVIDFQYNPKCSNPTLVSNDSISENDCCKVPIVKSSLLTLTPFGESDFILEEIKDFLNDDSIPDEIDDSVFDPKGDIRLIEKLLNADPCSLPPMDLKLAKESKEKSSVEEPPELELKDFLSHLEKKLLSHALMEPSRTDACPLACVMLRKKLTEAPILGVPNWNLPFELMCDASDYAIGAVLGQRKLKHFQPIHYATKTMTEAQIHYTTTEKEMLAVVYAFEKFRP